MLAEALHYVLTPCPLGARRRKHLAAAVSLWSRATRCAAAWAPHEARCRAAVAEAVAGLSQRRIVLVLGSGLMRDVDLDFLTASFQEVILADIVHLWPIRLRALFLPRVRLATVDLAAPGALAHWQGDPEIDLVISANVLSQLPLFSSPAAVPLHLEGLRGFGGPVCLLTDTEMERRSRAGTVLERRDLLGGAALPPPPLSWEWTVAPFGEAEADAAWVHRARAYPRFFEPPVLR